MKFQSDYELELLYQLEEALRIEHERPRAFLERSPEVERLSAMNMV